MACLIRAANQIGERHGIRFDDTGEVGQVWCPECANEWEPAMKLSPDDLMKKH